MIAAAWLLAALQLAGLSEDLATCRGIAEAKERLACYDALTPTAKEIPPPPKEPPPLPKEASPPVENFGARSLPPPPKIEEPERIEAHLFGKQDGWHKGTRFALDNGQVWVCIDDQEGFDLLDGNAVTIQRNRIGSYWMHVARVAGDIRVRREQ